LSALKLGVLVSGSGTNLQAIIDSIKSGKLKVSVEVVISSREDAFAIKRAKESGIEAVAICPEWFPSKAEYEEAMINKLREAKVELVVLAGFLKVLSPHFIRAFAGRIINIHPSLIPAFCGKGYYGLKVHKAGLEYGAKVTDATVHYADEGTDTGPIILQKAVEVRDDDTPEILSKRVLEVEHEILPEAIRLFAEKKLDVVGRRVFIKE